MSGANSGSEDSTCASPSLSARIHDPFLDANMIPSNETDPEERSLYQAKGVFSQSSTQPDERSGEPVQTMSTPDLSFTASSSPCRFATRESPSLHAASCGRLQCRIVAPFTKATSSHSSFVHRLDYLLLRAADQQFQPRIGENTRIQLDCPEAVPRSVSPMASIAYDEVTASELDPEGHDSHLLALSLRRSQRSSSLVRDLSDNNTLATGSCDADHDSRRNKRKGSYLSASDVASPAQSPCPDVLCPPFKKRKRLSLDVSPLFPVSPADSPVVSDKNFIPSEPLPVRKNRGSDFNATHYASKGVQYPSPSHSLSQDGQDFKSLDLSNALSTCESHVSYPPTEISTSPLGLSPVPIPDLRNFPEADIPRVFWSSDDAAVARLMSLLRKEARYHQTVWFDVFVDPDLALKDNLAPDVIAWILTVEPPLGSPTASSIRGRAHSHDLHEQLTVHHDSRFLAALIFSLFFFGQARHSEVSKEVHQSDTRNYEAMKGGENKVIWDYAIAAIALSVKMHRDIYPPLKPIFGHHFLALAHHEMRLEDLELAQRRLLRHFSYNLGIPTPQEFLDELPVALPTLRLTLGSERAWQDVLEETWKQLISAAHWPNVLRFPVSLLTATAISHAIRSVAHHRSSLLKGERAVGCPNCACDCHMKAASGKFLQNTVLEHEQRDAGLSMLRSTSGVLEDIRAVLGLPVGKIEECEAWLAQVRAASEKPFRSKYFRDVTT